MTYIFLEEIVAAFSQVISPGSDVMVHAALKKFGTFMPGVEIIIDALSSVLGPDGTIVMMTDTRSFAQTGRYDINQPSETGLLTEVFRKYEGVLRSLVPMVSFAAKGVRASHYVQTYHSYLDPTSPYTKILENDGEILLLGVPYQKCTLWHVSEEFHKVPDNYYMTFDGFLVSDGSIISPISQRYFVRRNLDQKKDISIVGRMIEDRSQVKASLLGGSFVRTFKARHFHDCCMDALGDDIAAFSRFQDS